MYGLDRPTYLCLKCSFYTDYHTTSAIDELRATHLPVLCSVPLSKTFYHMKTENSAAPVFIPICASAAPAWRIIMAITIKDVARLSGVSVTTVSRALNHRGYVSKNTTDKIESVIQELNYSPNQLARSLFNSQTKAIGLVVPSISHPFFSQMTQLIEQKLYEYGYHILLCTTDNNQDRESNILRILRQHRMDGIIMASPSLPDHEYKKLGIPIVAFDTLMESADVSIEADHTLGGKMAADILIQNDCKYAVQIIGNPDEKTDARMRHRKFMEIMVQSGRPCVSIPVMQKEIYPTLYETVADKVLNDYPDADAFFATDLFALALLSCSLRKKKRIPDEIQLIGYDGTHTTSLIYPKLTTIRQPFENLSDRIVQSMMQLLNGETVQQRIILHDLQVITGETTRIKNNERTILSEQT